ncbi:MAG TPA: zinc ribbon domain-containing protein [Terriglobales bacterium]|nr:zinc ribbon domain-containing protein [Terriglobales bacterium]
MAFCTSCGAPMDATATACARCGARATPVAAPPSPAAVQRPPARGGALKLVLIILAVALGFGVIGIGAATYIAVKFARHSRIEEREGRTNIQTPLGSVQTSKDPAEIASRLGVPIYPGAKVADEGAMVNMAGAHVASGVFTSDDDPQKVFDFYRERYPQANVKRENAGTGEIVLTSGHKVLTIKVQAQGSGSRIEIANVGGIPTDAQHSDEKREPY